MRKTQSKRIPQNAPIHDQAWMDVDRMASQRVDDPRHDTISEHGCIHHRGIFPVANCSPDMSSMENASESARQRATSSCNASRPSVGHCASLVFW